MMSTEKNTNEATGGGSGLNAGLGMKLHAGSLYKDILVLYDEMRTRAFVIQVIDNDRQWGMYCNDVDLFFDGGVTGSVFFNGETTQVPAWEIDIKNRIEESMRIADRTIMRA